MRDEMGLDLNDPHNSFAVGVNIATGANGEPVFSGAAILARKPISPLTSRLRPAPTTSSEIR